MYLRRYIYYILYKIIYFLTGKRGIFFVFFFGGCFFFFLVLTTCLADLCAGIVLLPHVPRVRAVHLIAIYFHPPTPVACAQAI